jgi:hypothetical protein
MEKQEVDKRVRSLTKLTKDLLIWPPLYLKPPRLKKTSTEMKPKNPEKILARRRCLLLHFLKTLE